MPNPARADLVFGIVAAVGSPVTYITNVIEAAMRKRGYAPRTLHLSRYTKALRLSTPWPPEGTDAYTRIGSLMKRGNELRANAQRGDILAMFAAAEINALRDEPNTGKAFILRQLKHPDEVYALRRIYGDGFHTVGIYCPKRARRKILHRHEGMDPGRADELIERDENEPPTLGQKFRDTFYLSDVFISCKSEEAAEAESQVDRFLNLLFGTKVISPHRDEYGMYLAHAAALRSSSLARQVGAAILSPHGEVLAVGTNEVPRAGGGQYWQDESPDSRDHVRGIDTSDAFKTEIMTEILAKLQGGWDDMSPEEQHASVADAIRNLKDARIMNLTEFMRAVHAEMEALSSALRVGVSTRGATLYTTTFPCHGCAKHIVVAGICRVVYIEPYPKSLAMDLHDDSIALEEGSESTDKVRFEPFVGVAPRRYTDLFSTTTRDGVRIRRKDSAGRVIEGEPQLRISMADSTYMQREANVARELKDLIGEPDNGTEENH